MLQKNRNREETGQHGGTGKRQNLSQTSSKNNSGQDSRNKHFEEQGNKRSRRGAGGNLRERGIREMQ